ncbi:carbamoyl phosphate synthase small subunit [Streptococcus sp. E29BA]|uniref:carbamoyl phosphate synthase small subunit n=1 Tax=Streptococcus sp. E29BA TaxID=3278716 RepID=UPI00359D7DDB
MAKRYLILEDGTVFEGEAFGADVTTTGELVFTTGMVGYQETITDPAHAGHLVVFTYPTIGNYGLNADDDNSFYSDCRGVIVYEWGKEGSNWRSQMTLDEFLRRKGIPGISGLDTRALTRLIRDRGSIRAQLTDQRDEPNQVEAIEQNLVDRVSTKTAYALPGTGRRVVILDLGLKQALLKTLKHLDWQVTVVPWDSSAEQILALAPSGLILSSGPGRAHQLPQVVELVRSLQDSLPILGLGLGHRVLALANGARVERLAVGHHGTNHAVREIETGRVTFTLQSQTEAAVDADLPEQLEVLARHLNDQSIQATRHQSLAVMGIDYEPTRQTFMDWQELMTKRQEQI